MRFALLSLHELIGPHYIFDFLFDQDQIIWMLQPTLCKGYRMLKQARVRRTIS